MAASATWINADELKITDVEYFGPVGMPVWLDTQDKTPNEQTLLEIKVNPKRSNFQSMELSEVPKEKGLHIIACDLENRDFTKVKVDIKGPETKEVTLDGVKLEGETNLHPGTHRLIVKYVGEQVPEIIVRSSKDGAIQQVKDGTRMFTLEDVMHGTRIAGAKLSPKGTYMLVDYYDTDTEGKNTNYQKLYNTATGQPVMRIDERAAWMPKSEKYYVMRQSYADGRSLVAVDPSTGKEQILATNLPDGNFVIAPTEDFLVFDLVKEGRKENPKAYQVLEPEDRIPGWRNRHYPAILRLDGNNLLQPIGSGKNNLSVLDITKDGKKALCLTNRSRLEKRPTTVLSLMVVDLNTLEVDTLVHEDGFIAHDDYYMGSAMFSPDGSEVLVVGSPEAFDRIGCTLPADKIPSMTENELFIINVEDKTVRPITKDFDPSIQNVFWSRNDGKIYTRVEERDIYAFYVIDPKDGSYKRLDVDENIVKGFGLSEGAPLMAWWGQSDSNPDGLYITDLKSGKTRKLDAPSEERLRDVRLGKCEDWNFTSRNGDTIYGRYYLPDNFDPTKKYPLIVNYYGGCSPSQRLFESRYPWHVYTELGYIVYVIQPSGATGFGQEWASRHVNTAGQGVAEDIIEGLDKFLVDHPYVDAERVGCIGASYGGFMTQYLQTVTDKFACAISHAGISDHTSYWGNGYWGYSYSEVSMAESYPWSDTDLYVKQSPLFRADKISTPLLLLHGDGDTNVPPAESVQMFTALKLLGAPVALVEIEKQDHHIKDIEKRKLWQDTIFAWFAKYLKGDSTWWDEMYPGLEE